MKIIFDYNRTLFNPETDSLFPGVFALLETLSERCDLYLISRDEPGRTDRLEELGIKKFFQKVAFVREKTPELFIDLAGSSERTLVIGDRAVEEIRIGNELGMTTIWIQHGRFAGEVSAADHVVQDIREVEHIISTYEK